MLDLERTLRSTKLKGINSNVKLETIDASLSEIAVVAEHGDQKSLAWRQ